jgi:CHASE1-domain containing sensor protein
MIMWTPLVTLIALVLLTAASAATAVALTTTDHQRALRALTLLKILLGAILGSSGVLAAVIHLHQAGLL